ncbi:hypothetical protein ABZV60_34925, partial [Streptomyces sp. NPDC004787]
MGVSGGDDGTCLHDNRSCRLGTAATSPFGVGVQPDGAGPADAAAHPRPNALLTEACVLAKNAGRQDKFTALALTGRAVSYIAAHVPGEINDHLAKTAHHHEVPENLARRPLEQRILSSLRVVDLEIRDHLSPQTRHILRVDHEMPRRAAFWAGLTRKWPLARVGQAVIGSKRMVSPRLLASLI